MNARKWKKFTSKSQKRKLHNACIMNDIATVTAMLTKRVNPDVVSKKGFTGLMAASQYGSRHIVELLLSNGANIDMRNHSGATSLSMAVFFNQLEVVELLVENNADLTFRYQYSSTLLHIAADKGHLTLVNRLIEIGLDPNAKNSDGDTPLHYASKNKSLEMVDVLVAAGAKIDVKSHSGGTPLMVAAASGGVDIMRRLIQLGADVNLSFASRIQIYLQNNETGTEVRQSIFGFPLLYTIAIDSQVLNQYDVIKELLDSGADPAVRCAVTGLTAQEAALSFGNKEVAELISQYSGKQANQSRVGANSPVRLFSQTVQERSEEKTEAQRFKFN